MSESREVLEKFEWAVWTFGKYLLRAVLSPEDKATIAIAKDSLVTNKAKLVLLLKELDDLRKASSKDEQRQEQA